MFLFWLIIFIVICIGEEAKLSYDAKKNPYQTPDCFKKKPWEK